MPVGTEVVGGIAKTNGVQFGDARTASAAGLLCSPILVVSRELGWLGGALFFEVQFFCYFVVGHFFAVAIAVDDLKKFAAGIVVDDVAFVDGFVEHFGDYCAIGKGKLAGDWSGHPWRWLGGFCCCSCPQWDHPWRLFLGVENITQFIHCLLSLFTI